jgi:hypothetical protein
MTSFLLIFKKYSSCLHWLQSGPTSHGGPMHCEKLDLIHTSLLLLLVNAAPGVDPGVVYSKRPPNHILWHLSAF